jgi:hypothetical protein
MNSSTIEQKTLDPEAVERDRAERRAETIKAIKRQRTMVQRWSNRGALSADPLWDKRAAAAGALVPSHFRRILDVGCGDMKLERYLPEGSTYIPLDVVPRDDRTIVVDLNRSRLPKVEADFVVGMGVLEYLFDIPGFLRQIARQVPEGLFSYHPLEASPARDRLAVGWVNALNSRELLALFRAAGYKSIQVHEYAPSLHFYRVSRLPPSKVEGSAEVS